MTLSDTYVMLAGVGWLVYVFIVLRSEYRAPQSLPDLR